jgi:hypothetical protein
MNDFKFDKCYEALKKYNPKLTIAYKNESQLMKLIGLIMFFNSGFNDKYITTIGNTVYFPTKESISNKQIDSIIVLAHEFTHTKDSARMGNILYSILYLMPQILFLLIFPAIFFIGWYSLLFFIFLLPLPAYWRTNIEIRGYTTSLFGYNYFYKNLNFDAEEIHDKLYNASEEIIKNNFNGPAYYFMWPFGLRKKFDQIIKDIESGDILKTDEVFHQIQESFILSSK